jgi:Xaa-Pro aminopeptidase
MQIYTFSASTYIQRRQRLAAELTSGLILFLGNDEAPRNYKDNTYHFRQDSNFLYYFGLSIASLAATLDIDTGEAVIYGNELTIDDIVWTGPLPSIVEMASKVGVFKTEPLEKISTIIDHANQTGRKIHYLPPYRGDNKIKISKILSTPVELLDKGISIDLIKAVVKQRETKEAQEIEQMHEATIITSEMHLAAMRAAKPDMYEYEVMSHVDSTAIRFGGTNSFPTILTVRGETLHNHYHGNKLKSGQLVLCDAGAENKMSYCGDMTCTFPVDKTFSTQQKEIYDIVLHSQESAAAIMKPGVLFRDVYWHACRVIVDGLKSLGLMKGDTDEAVAQGAHAIVFQCGLGHMIGLDVHDMEDLGEQYVGYTPELHRSTQFGMKYLRLAKELKPNHCVTVEPGCYFIPTQMDLWKAENRFLDFINYNAFDKYRDFGGIRIEEDFVIIEDGHRLLGKRLPKTTSEIEEYRRHHSA